MFSWPVWRRPTVVVVGGCHNLWWWFVALAIEGLVVLSDPWFFWLGKNKYYGRVVSAVFRILPPSNCVCPYGSGWWPRRRRCHRVRWLFYLGTWDDGMRSRWREARVNVLTHTRTRSHHDSCINGPNGAGKIPSSGTFFFFLLLSEKRFQWAIFLGDDDFTVVNTIQRSPRSNKNPSYKLDCLYCSWWLFICFSIEF